MPERDEIPLIKTRRLMLTLPPTSAAQRMVGYVTENREHHAPWSPPVPKEYFTEKYWRERLRTAREEFKRWRAATGR